LIKDTIKHERIEVDTPCDIDFVKVECANDESLIIKSAYRPTNYDEPYAHSLFNIISKVCKTYKKSSIWITADFNLPDINWTSNTIQGHYYRKAINEAFLHIDRNLA